MAEQTRTETRRPDPNPQRRGLKEGLLYGLVAGAIFAVAEIAAAAMMGDPALMPIRMFASILLGEAALAEVTLGAAVVVGLLVHFVLSAIFGVTYGAIVNGVLSPTTRGSMGAQTAIGLGFGAVLWLVNFQIIGRLLFPWFLMAPQFAQLVLHAVFFGLPLGLMFAASERRMAWPTRARAPA
jgi:hypothetical protein